MLLGDTATLREQITADSNITVAEVTATVSDETGAQVATGTLSGGEVTITGQGTKKLVLYYSFTPPEEKPYVVNLKARVGEGTAAQIKSFVRSIWVVAVPPGRSGVAVRNCWLITKELGKDNDRAFFELLHQWWTLYEDKNAIALRLRYLYVKRHAIVYLLGQVWEYTDYTEEVQESLDQWTKHLQGLLDAIDKEIAAVETSAATGRIALGPITQTAPILPCPFEADPNSRQIRGDPLRRSFGYRTP